MAQRRTSIPDSDDQRESLLHDPVEIADREAINAANQFDHVKSLIRSAMDSEQPFLLRPSIVCDLNRLAIDGIMRSAGVYRTKPIVINGSNHDPPQHELIPRLVEEMCDYVQANQPASAIHIASYLMWRINWIHPFVEGNGRTSRAVSYLMLCIRSGQEFPGTLTIPEQISSDRSPYYTALDEADDAWESGVVDVSAMEELMKRMLAEQLLSAFDRAEQTND